MIYDQEVCAHKRTYSADRDGWMDSLLDTEMLLGIEKIECRHDITEEE